MTDARRQRSLLGRLFSGLWTLFVVVYRSVFVLLLVVGGVVAWLALRGGTPATIEDNIALVVYPSGALVETRDEDPGRVLFERLSGEPPSQSLLRDMVEALDRAAADDRVPLAVLRLDALGAAGLPQFQEIASAVSRFRAAGKPVHAYAPWYDQGPYLAASAADHVALDPLGVVFLPGFAVYKNYYREAIEKLDAEVAVFRVGEFKSAVEPFERDSMSDAAREANVEWLGDLWRSYGHAVGAARGLASDAAHAYALAMPGALTERGGDGATLARDLGWVDEVESLQAFRKRIATQVGWSTSHGSFRQVHHLQYLEVSRRERPDPDGTVIGLVVVQGEIIDGESEPGLAGGDTISGLLSDARLDDEVAAVVLRVDSPGGSVTASEQIRREVRALRDAGKPVVVSMASVAASGGYWISMDADEIWAHDTTVTGSIGIFAIWPSFEGSLGKLGIRSDGVGTTPLAGAFRWDRALTPPASAVIQSQLERGYRLFVDGVAQGRQLEVSAVEDLARGRVWSGGDAHDHGLVDGLGGLGDAVEAAVRLAALDDGRWSLREFRQAYDFRFWDLLDLLSQTRVTVSPWGGGWLDEATSPLQGIARSLRWLNDPNGLYTHCFCRPGDTRRGALR